MGTGNDRFDQWTFANDVIRPNHCIANAKPLASLYYTSAQHQPIFNMFDKKSQLLTQTNVSVVDQVKYVINCFYATKGCKTFWPREYSIA